MNTARIIGLIVNLVLPGLGTIIGATELKSKDKETYMNKGIAQLIVAIVSIPLCFILVGFITGFAMWIWSIITSIQMLNI